MSFTEFFNQMLQNPMLFVSTLLTLGVILVNGWTDAPNAIATCVSTRAIGVRPAIIMAAIFNFFGVLIMTALNASVAMTIYNMVDFGGDARLSLIALCAAMAAIVIWATAAWYFGIPTSESHALIAGLSGAAMAFMHGAQDGQKFMAIFLLGAAFANGQAETSSFTVPIWLMVLCSLVMGLGTSIGGYRIIKSVGMDMVKLKPYQGFAADFAATLCLLFSSLTGIPVSTTHTKTTAIMGVGAAKRLRNVNFGVVRDLVLTWIFTFPGCGLLGYLTAKLFLVLFA